MRHFMMRVTMAAAAHFGHPVKKGAAGTVFTFYSPAVRLGES
jgi:hypothetical protein